MTQAAPSTGNRQGWELQAILDAMVDGVVVVDALGTICFANPAAEALFDRPSGDLLGTPFGLPASAVGTQEIRVVRRGGETGVVEVQRTRILWEGREALLASLRDITEVKRGQAVRDRLVREHAAREEVEAALRDRDAFINVLNHELRTPLTRLKLWLRRAVRRDSMSSDPDLRLAVGEAELETEQLSRLLAQILELCRLEQGERALFPIRTDLSRQVSRLAERVQSTGEGRTIAVRVPDGPLLATVDTTAIEQIVASMLSYAGRQTAPDGEVEVKLLRGEEEHDRRLCQVACIFVQFEGSTGGHDGGGRPLFGRSFVAHKSGYADGAGLWFYVSRRLAQLHGGRLQIDEAGPGFTRVSLVLPVDGPSDPLPLS